MIMVLTVLCLLVWQYHSWLTLPDLWKQIALNSLLRDTAIRITESA